MLAFVLWFALSIGVVRGDGWEQALQQTAKISSSARQQLEQNVATTAQQDASASKSLIDSFLAADAGVQNSCGSCSQRDHKASCPSGWSGVGDGRCEASKSYGGYCAKTQSFIGLSVAGKMELEVICGVCWPCSGSKNNDALCTDCGDRKQSSASFLSARVLPVDSYKIRNSLFLSQPLRMPAAAAVNVIENEDTSRMYEEAKYAGMQSQASRLDRIVKEKFDLLAKSF